MRSKILLISSIVVALWTHPAVAEGVIVTHLEYREFDSVLAWRAVIRNNTASPADQVDLELVTRCHHDEALARHPAAALHLPPGAAQQVGGVVPRTGEETAATLRVTGWR